MMAVSENLVDLVWGGKRPSPPNSDLIFLDLQFSGESFPLSLVVMTL